MQINNKHKIYKIVIMIQMKFITKLFRLIFILKIIINNKIRNIDMINYFYITISKIFVNNNL